MQRSIHAYVVKALRECEAIEVVALRTKVPLSTLRKIRDGHIPNPGIQSMEKLYFHFKDTEGKRLRAA